MDGPVSTARRVPPASSRDVGDRCASNATDAVIRNTLTPASPNCTGSAGNKCLCRAPATTPTPILAARTPSVRSGQRTDRGPICEAGGAASAGGERRRRLCRQHRSVRPSSCGRPGETTQPEGLYRGLTRRTRDPVSGQPTGTARANALRSHRPALHAGVRPWATWLSLTDADCGGHSRELLAGATRASAFRPAGEHFQPGGGTPGRTRSVAFGMADSPMADVSHSDARRRSFASARRGRRGLNAIVGLRAPPG